MHDIVKSSKWHLALTGTIAAGYANNLFYMLYRLDPQMMVDKGFEHSAAGERAFSEAYGTIETEYEILESKGEYNTMTRGRMIGSPKCRPGISPLVYSEFLLKSTVFLNLSDMSEYLPALNEDVVIVPLEDEISSIYRNVRETLSSRIKEFNGQTLLGSFLQFSLSYSDKPYGHGPIICPITGDIITEPSDLSCLIEDGKLLNKEKRLVELVNQELSENRNIFLYCNYTGSGDGTITYRLKEVLENNCMAARGKIAILESSYPSAEKREEWVHKKAEEGIRLFITNPRCVRTGLDFRFDYQDIPYNFPTIIFYQTDHDMFTIWQAARRHYRLNQDRECRTYFLVSEGTIQLDAVALVASKQVATLALQGKFSSDGLCAMAVGVDARIKLAQAAAEKSITQERGLKGMFDVLNSYNNSEKQIRDYQPMLTFYELTGRRTQTEELVEELANISQDNTQDLLGLFFDDIHEDTEYRTTSEVQENGEGENIGNDSFNEIDALFTLMFGASYILSNGDKGAKEKNIKRTTKGVIHGQYSVLSLFDM